MSKKFNRASLFLAYNSVTSRPATSSYKVGYSQPGYNQEPHMRYPEYANPGVYYNRMARRVRETERVESPPFPWEKARELALTADWENWSSISNKFLNIQNVWSDDISLMMRCLQPYYFQNILHALLKLSWQYK